MVVQGFGDNRGDNGMRVTPQIPPPLGSWVHADKYPPLRIRNGSNSVQGATGLGVLLVQDITDEILEVGVVRLD